jgi:flavorubredoxin
MTTTIDEIEEGIYRIHTPIPEAPGGFSFNQYLVVDEQPLLFHTGPRRLAPAVRAAVARVIPFERLRWIGLSHVEADECGGLAELLAHAPSSTPVCSQVAAMVSIGDLSDRPPHALADAAEIRTGRRTFRWIDAPHVPHGWDCGFLFEESTRTLFCGDLFTQPGADSPPVTEADVLGPSEAFRRMMDYWAHAPSTGATLEKMAALAPRTLACMHGSAFRGDGGKLIRALAGSLGAT